jgi:hypothetical protein
VLELKSTMIGDPLFSILLNTITYMLAILIARAKENWQIGSLVPHLVDGGFLFCNILMILFCLWNTI